MRRPHLFGDDCPYFFLFFHAFLFESFKDGLLKYFGVGIYPPAMVDGRLGKMSRDYISYLKGLCVPFALLCLQDIFSFCALAIA